MKYLKIFVLLILVTSCNKKEIQLPKIGEKGIANIQNNSSIWMFFNVIENDTVAVLNKNNKISNTHLIFNIDKRLPLRVIMPKLYDIQEKLKKDSPHKSEGMRNYFNYADTLSKTYALFDFTNTNYIFTQEAYEKSISEIYEEKNRNPILINIDKNSITIDQEKSDDLYRKLKTKTANDSIKNRTIFLSFNKNLTYKKYLNTKTKLFNKGYKIENTEYIYSKE